MSPCNCTTTDANGLACGLICHPPLPTATPQNRRVRGVEVVASLWNRNGDHPDDGPDCCEGKVVRYYRNPSVLGDRECERCGMNYRDHGWIDDPTGGHTVCPGDWIVTDRAGRYFPVAPSVFAALFAPVDVEAGEEPTTGSAVVELPMYLSVGEHGDAHQVGTITARIDVEAES